MSDYSVKYTRSFKDSLGMVIDEWEQAYDFSNDKIKQFVRSIYKSIELVSVYPKRHEEISTVYKLKEKTYRILIGNNYAILYRIDESNKTILIGSFFNQSQMHVQF